MALPRLLIVDDEPMVLSSLRRLLRRSFDVETVQHAEAALVILGSGTRHFEAVLCDVAMPGMTGPDLQSAVRQTAGAAMADRFVWMSATDISAQGPRLQKPFAPEDVQRTVDSLGRRLKLV